MAITSTLTTSFKKELLTATHNFATNGNAFKLEWDISDGWSFDNRKEEALRFEEEYQITNAYLGYIYGNNWRKIQSDKCLKDNPSSYKQKKIQCIDNQSFIFFCLEIFTRVCLRVDT